MRRILALAIVMVAALLLTACTHIKTVTTTTTKTVTTGGLSPAPEPQQQRYQTPYGPSAHSPTFGKPPTSTPQPPTLTLAPTTPMYDSVNAGVLPAGSKAYAGYTSGYWPTFLPIKARFPTAAVVSIAVNASHTAQCLDIETGDATASQAPEWFRADRAAGFTKPCFYSSLSNWPAVRSALDSAGISRSSYFAWDADWTYSAHLDAGYDATQWTDHYDGLNVDASTVTYAFAGIGASPDVKPKPKTPRHHDWLPNTRRSFKVKGRTIHARERMAVTQWDSGNKAGFGCRNPVKRKVCQTLRAHMLLLEHRISFVAHHTGKHLKHKVAKPRWGAVHYRAGKHKTTLGGAYQQFAHRLSMKHHGVVTSW